MTSGMIASAGSRLAFVSIIDVTSRATDIPYVYAPRKLMVLPAAVEPSVFAPRQMLPWEAACDETFVLREGEAAVSLGTFEGDAE